MLLLLGQLQIDVVGEHFSLVRELGAVVSDVHALLDDLLDHRDTGLASCDTKCALQHDGLHAQVVLGQRAVVVDIRADSLVPHTAAARVGAIEEVLIPEELPHDVQVTMDDVRSPLSDTHALVLQGSVSPLEAILRRVRDHVGDIEGRLFV